MIPVFGRLHRPTIAVYDGGWFEWSKDPTNNPIEVGEPRDEFAA